MKKTIFTLLLIAVCSASFAVKVERSFYFDFGNSNNQVTESPDANGNHWNNVTGATAGESLLLNDAKGTATTFSIVSTTKFESNGASAGGGLLSPSADLLGDLAIATATQDYLFASQSNHYTFTITGLDPLKGYQFKIFGSRSATDVSLRRSDQHELRRKGERYTDRHLRQIRRLFTRRVCVRQLFRIREHLRELFPLG